MGIRKKMFVLFAGMFYTIGFSWGSEYKNCNLFIDVGAAQGEILKTNDYVRGKNQYGLPITDYSAGEIRFGWQTLGTKQWQRALLLPYYGIGLHSSYFVNEDYFGLPYSVYFFFGGPYRRKPKYSFDYEFSFGLSYNWNPYNTNDNPFNIAIGSKQNAYLDLRTFYSRIVFKRMEFQAGLRATHFSNGSTTFPNKGLNIISPFVNLRCHITQRKIYPSDNKVEEHNPVSEFNILFTTGVRSVKHTKTFNSDYVGIMNLSLEYLKPAVKIWKYGLGLDIGIDQNKNLYIDGDYVKKAPVRDQFYLGSALLGQFRANNLAVQADLGMELISRKYSFGKRFYQRIGMRYYVSRRVIAGVRVKAHKFSKANYIEWCLGYSLHRKG